MPLLDTNLDLLLDLKLLKLSQKAKFNHIRFLGAAGIGMSAQVRILEGLKEHGLISDEIKISKSDISYENNDPLDKDIDLVVRSTAIKDSDPEFAELKSRGIEIWHRSDMLNYLSSEYKQIVVTGTHGKTTCSALVAHILKDCGEEPAYAIGGILKNYNSNGEFGEGDFFVLEGDESDKSFSKTNPEIALVTNIEADHLENYPGGIKEIKALFFDFLHKAPQKVLCIDNPHLLEYFEANKDSEDIISYSLKNKEADFYLDLEDKILRIDSFSKEYQLDIVNVEGEYNLLNAVGAIATALLAGTMVQEAIFALKNFQGIKRRFDLVNEKYQAPSGSRLKVYDDYAHHPTEVAELINAIKKLDAKKILFVYQPHHPERTQQFWQDFVEVFKAFPDKHECYIADVYVARSKHIDGITSEALVKDIAKDNVKYLAPEQKISTQLGNYSMADALKGKVDELIDGHDCLFVVGAGNIATLAEAFA